jgi:hypothetical protein
LMYIFVIMYRGKIQRESFLGCFKIMVSSMSFKNIPGSLHKALNVLRFLLS